MRKMQRALADGIVLLLYLMAGFLLLSAVAGDSGDSMRLLSIAVTAIGCVYLARSIREEQKGAPP
jgi:hypothetical protein